MSTIENILDLVAPQFKDVENKQDYINQAVCEVSECYFGKLYNRAVALLTAHYMALALDPLIGSSPGGVRSKREGRAAISYGNSGVNGEYGMTSYGVQYKQLLDSMDPGIRVTGIGFCGC